MTTETLIIGAGPCGIGLACELSARRKDFLIAGRYMDLWLNHTHAQMRLRSETKASSLHHPQNLFDFSKYLRARQIDLHGRPPVKLFREYLLWCKERLTFPVIEETALSVEPLLEGASRFRTTLSGGVVIDSRNVAVAAGLGPHRYIPESFSHLRNVVHSYDLAAYRDITGQNVVVAGAGQSAFEAIELLLRNGNRVSWYCRRAPRFMNQPSYLPRFVFSFLLHSPHLVCRLPQSVRRMINRIASSATVTRNYKSLVQEILRVSPEEISPDQLLIAATGYRLRPENMAFLSPGLLAHIRKENEAPELDQNFQSSVEGLYFIGPIAESRFGPAMRFIIGAHSSSKIVRDAICGAK